MTGGELLLELMKLTPVQLEYPVCLPDVGERRYGQPLAGSIYILDEQIWMQEQ